MVETITVATANTHYADLLKDRAGLAPFNKFGADALLLQEVLGIDERMLKTRLEAQGYRLAHFDEPSGLAIALGRYSDLKLTGDLKTTQLQHPGRLASLATERGWGIASRLRSRAVISVQTETVAGNALELATTHPIVFLRSVARARQVRALGEVIKGPAFGGNNLIVGADMNHYPGPRPSDERMRLASGLSRLVLPQPTWRVSGSRHEWAAIAGSIVSGRSVDSYDAELDAILFRGVSPVEPAEVIDITSDHRAIVASFSLGH